jgi:maltooligosyltrehalose trehalohydrolase
MADQKTILPEVKKSHAHQMPFGTRIIDGMVNFQIWAPSAKQVEVCLYKSDAKTLLPMQQAKNGWFDLTSDRASVGMKYHFVIENDLYVPDPASRFQPDDAHGPSEILDPASFDWQDLQWFGKPWEEAILYELHIGTFSPAGTYKGVQERLDDLLELGVTAIELMPLSDFPGAHGWGYDGVLPFAPESRYGRPEDLKELIQAAHQKGLMVFVDVVYNHFGPDGNFLHAYAKQFFTERHKTPWGAAIDFDGADSAVVRDFFIQNALYWFNEYRIDGLRLDAVHAITDESKNHFLRELAERVSKGPGLERRVHLVLENDKNEAEFLNRGADHHPQFHTAQWNDDIHHAFHVLATGETAGYYEDYAKDASGKSPIEHLGICLTEGFAYQGQASHHHDGEKRGQPSSHLPPTAFVSFIQNHDQIGNRALGERLSSLVNDEILRAVATIYLIAPSIPMLFMGEEWASKKPFYYFCDLSAELAPLITEGRRKEFAKFPEFSTEKMREKIPDPCVPQTFEKSKLDWHEREQASHSQMLQHYRRLIAIRKEEIVPKLLKWHLHAGSQTDKAVRSSYEVIGETTLFAKWSLSAHSGGSQLMLIANLGAEELDANSVAKLKELLSVHGEFLQARIIYESHEQSLAALASGKIDPWSVIWLFA